MHSRLRPAARRIFERAPLALFLLSLAAGLIAYGIAIERHGVFPGSILDDAEKTVRATVRSVRAPDTGSFLSFSDTPLDGFLDRRVEVAAGDALADAVLLYGARHQFRELCPEHGCLAVAVTPSGGIAHAWPFRPNAIHAANIVAGDEYPYELNAFSPERDMQPFGIEQYANGDLLVAFRLWNAFPYGGGVARIDRDGRPVWFRRDYSHHWPHLMENGVALVPSFSITDDPLALSFPGATEIINRLCQTRTYLTMVNVVDGAGDLLDRISVVDALLDSPWRGVLYRTINRCDPLHLNGIDVIRDVPGLPEGVEAGDLILSLRNVSAFVIMDKDSHRLKRLVRGTFYQQHSVQHLDGSRFLLFDNLGGDATGGPSRLLMVDLDDGETTIFPNAGTPDGLQRLFSIAGSMVAISPDRQRALVTFTRAGTGVEVRLADGKVLGVFRSLHDVSDLEQFSGERLERAALFWLEGMDYLRTDIGADR